MAAPTQKADRCASFEAFYPFYLHQHSNKTCRRIHVIGTSLVAGAFVAFLMTLNPWWLLAMPLVGYRFARVGRLVFEKNRPATYQYPLWSLMGDWRMWFETPIGRRPF